eukprot:15472060-Alexandrium_andersonii.AAC.1
MALRRRHPMPRGRIPAVRRRRAQPTGEPQRQRHAGGSVHHERRGRKCADPGGALAQLLQSTGARTFAITHVSCAGARAHARTRKRPTCALRCAGARNCARVLR